MVAISDQVGSCGWEAYGGPTSHLGRWLPLASEPSSSFALVSGSMWGSECSPAS